METAKLIYYSIRGLVLLAFTVFAIYKKISRMVVTASSMTLVPRFWLLQVLWRFVLFFLLGLMSRQGQGLLATTVVHQLTGGPLANAVENLNRAAEVTVCHMEVFAGMTKARVEMAVGPAEGILRKMSGSKVGGELIDSYRKDLTNVGVGEEGRDKLTKQCIAAYENLSTECKKQANTAKEACEGAYVVPNCDEISEDKLCDAATIEKGKEKCSSVMSSINPANTEAEDAIKDDLTFNETTWKKLTEFDVDESIGFKDIANDVRRKLEHTLRPTKGFVLNVVVDNFFYILNTVLWVRLVYNSYLEAIGEGAQE